MTSAEAVRAASALFRAAHGRTHVAFEWAVEFAPDGDMDATVRRIWDALDDDRHVTGLLIFCCRAEQSRFPSGARRWCKHRRQAADAVGHVWDLPMGHPERTRRLAADAIRAAVPCPTFADFAWSAS